MALNGGMGIIHYNMAPKDQIKAVARVKRHIHGLIQDPITVHATQTIGDLLVEPEAEEVQRPHLVRFAHPGASLRVGPTGCLAHRFERRPDVRLREESGEEVSSARLFYQVRLPPSEPER